MLIKIRKRIVFISWLRKLMYIFNNGPKGNMRYCPHIEFIIIRVVYNLLIFQSITHKPLSQLELSWT